MCAANGVIVGIILPGLYLTVCCPPLQQAFWWKASQERGGGTGGRKGYHSPLCRQQREEQSDTRSRAPSIGSAAAAAVAAAAARPTADGQGSFHRFDRGERDSLASTMAAANSPPERGDRFLLRGSSVTSATSTDNRPDQVWPALRMPPRLQRQHPLCTSFLPPFDQNRVAEAALCVLPKLGLLPSHGI